MDCRIWQHLRILHVPVTFQLLQSCILNHKHGYKCQLHTRLQQFLNKRCEFHEFEVWIWCFNVAVLKILFNTVITISLQVKKIPWKSRYFFFHWSSGIQMMQRPFKHRTCGIFQIFHRCECVQVSGLSECCDHFHNL